MGRLLEKVIEETAKLPEPEQEAFAAFRQSSSQNVDGTSSLPDRRTCLREWPKKRGRNTARDAQSLLISTSCEIANHGSVSQAVRGTTGRRAQASAGRVPADNVIVWFWIGPHEQYETLLANL